MIGDFDTQTGFDFGVFLGPVIKLNENMFISVHVIDTYGYYYGNDPAGMQNVRPGGRVQFYWYR
jgi:hypothetical protein